MQPTKNIAIIGAGPAGLRAAETAAQAGANVTIFDSKPSSGRKFLIAGKRGLNLTHDEEWSAFITRYSGKEIPSPLWQNILTAFDNTQLRQWAGSLGINTFVASSGKVFPTEMKAAPLLKRWIDKLRIDLKVNFLFNHNCTDLQASQKNITTTFTTPEGITTKTFDAVILALGGGSWPSTGSTGEWVKIFAKHNINITPLTSANSGWEVNWNHQLIEQAEGLPLKNITASASNKTAVGELVITKYGLEGGPIYKLGPAIRELEKPEINIDFKPTHTTEQLIAKMESAKTNLTKEAKTRWKLNPAAQALLNDRFPEHSDPTLADLAKTIKKFNIPLTRPRPIEEAISSAGGIQWNELDDNLMLKKLPHVYCAGEMIDWEAPTGGYLLQACFATGDWAAKATLKTITTPSHQKHP